MGIELKELENFLNEANRHTYANRAAKKSQPTRLASEDYHFENGNLVYHDTYFGGHDFIGNEIVYKDKKPVWGMNYYGYLQKPGVSEKDVYDFLRQALMQEYKDMLPVRGPARYTMGSWRYANAADGGLNRFSGTEVIFNNGEEIYRCWYHGGFIS